MLGITYPLDCEQIGYNLYTEPECTLYNSLENVNYTLEKVKVLKQRIAHSRWLTEEYQ
jgi:hypothetical protein